MKDSFELVPGVPHKLDGAVTRIIAPNAGVMTGPGTNTYLIGTRELIVIDPGPDDESHMQAILGAAMNRAVLRPSEERLGFMRLGADELRQLGLGCLMLVVFAAALVAYSALSAPK